MNDMIKSLSAEERDMLTLSADYALTWNRPMAVRTVVTSAGVSVPPLEITATTAVSIPTQVEPCFSLSIKYAFMITLHVVELGNQSK
jgi:hypothetical protein